MIIGEASPHDEQVVLAEDLMDKEDWSGAAHEAGKVLEELEPSLETIARAALTRGRALMTHVLTEMSEKGELPKPEVFEDIWKAYEISKMIHPDCETTKEEMLKASYLLREIPPQKPPKEVATADVDVLIVGAGCSGVGTSLLLSKTFGLDTSRVLMVERGERIGETFRKWPKEMRFISPSFNQQGWTNSFDLNSVGKGTSPAYSLHTEHPSGTEYANYLEAIVKTEKLNVMKQTEVVSISEADVVGNLPLFNVEVRSTKRQEDPLQDPSKVSPTKTITARYIVWAAGEFQYPKGLSSTTAAATAKVKGLLQHEEKKTEEDSKSEDHSSEGLVGEELCLHNSKVRSWADLPGDDFIIIGGYESGVDACVNLSRAGKRSRVLASTPCWSVKTSDPSAELAPYTASRLRNVLASDHPPKLYAPLRVVKVERRTASVGSEMGGYTVTAKWRALEDAPHAPLRDLVNEAPTESVGETDTTLVLHTENPPILATGFEGSVSARAADLFAFAKKGHKGGCTEGAPLLTLDDESTIVPGVFLVGPQVVHGKLSFCFVYKFRQRFAVVANAICGGLGMDTRAAVSECREANMYLEEFSCCGDTCGDVC